MEKTAIIGIELIGLRQMVNELDEPSYRAEQIFKWLYAHKISSFDDMENLPKSFREALSDNYAIRSLKLLRITGSKTESTRKLLFELPDGQQIESVLMSEEKRTTVCLSSQVGCALKCEFCATGTMGFKRNLTAGEMVEQFLLLQNESKKPITNIVFMGMGEPLLNYENVISAAKLLNHPQGINVGARHITISTAGIVPQMLQFTDEKLRFKLAISLNGSSQEQRLQTMPIAKKYPVDELIAAARYYYSATRNFITFEYVLMSGINDSAQDAKQLMKLIDSLPCKVNIIPYNEIGGDIKRPKDKIINAFVDSLATARFTVTTRWSKGADINAGCGQLVVG